MPSEPTAAEDAVVLATLFHETYERLAPLYGYETRTETRRFDAESPNGKLMVATCAVILESRDRAAAADKRIAEVARDRIFVEVVNEALGTADDIEAKWKPDSIAAIDRFFDAIHAERKAARLALDAAETGGPDA